MKTIWKFVQKTTGIKGISYYVSNTGLIKTVSKNGKTRIYKGTDNGTGHLYCTIGFVHRIVARAFIPNPDHKPYIDHIDGNPLNNNVENLRWCTQKENLNFPIAVDRRNQYLDKKFGKKKKAVHNSIWWQQLDLDGNLVKEWESLSEAARQLNTKRSNLHNAFSRNGVSAGYRWKKIFKKTVYERRSL